MNDQQEQEAREQQERIDNLIATQRQFIRDLYVQTQRAQAAESQLAAKDAEIARLKEMFATEREDANQWLREEGIERKRADAAESALASYRAVVTRVEQENEHLRARLRALEPLLDPVVDARNSEEPPP